MPRAHPTCHPFPQASPGSYDLYEPRLGSEESGGEFLHCINLVRKQDDPTVRRGAVVKAMCICSRYNYIEVGLFGVPRYPDV